MIHPAIDYELIKTRIADLHRQAAQDGAVRAALHARLPRVTKGIQP